MLFFKNAKHIYMKWPGVLLVIMLSGILPACTHFLFQPQAFQFSTPGSVGVMYENLQIETQGQVKLHGWKLLAKDERRGTILFFHGNGENISSHFTHVHWLTDEGFDVLLFDYRGYGQSEGVAKLDDVISDVETMIKFGSEQLPEDEKLIVMGHSLGASLAIHAVAHSEFKNKIKAFIAVEAFADYHEIAQDMLSTSWLAWLFQWPLSFTVDNSYRPLSSVAKISPVPLMLMHSRQDEIISFKHAQDLYDQANQPKKLQVISGSHNLIFNQKENRKTLLEYFSTLAW